MVVAIATPTAPLQALLRELKVGANRGKRHVHDRDVEHHHEMSSTTMNWAAMISARANQRVRSVLPFTLSFTAPMVAATARRSHPRSP